MFGHVWTFDKIILMKLFGSPYLIILDPGPAHIVCVFCFLNIHIMSYYVLLFTIAFFGSMIS